MLWFLTFIFRSLVGLIFLLSIAVPVGILVWGVESRPVVVPAAVLNHDDVTRIKTLIKRNNPRSMQAGEQRSLTVTQRDLRLLLNYATAPHQGFDAGVKLMSGAARLQFSFTHPPLPDDKYINVSLLLVQDADLLVVEDLVVGRIDFPAGLTRVISRLLHRYLMRHQEYADVLNAINGFRIMPGNVVMVYEWQPELARRLQQRGRGLLAPDQGRLMAYTEEIARISHTLARKASLQAMLTPLYELAVNRSGQAGADPVEENRALGLAMTLSMPGSRVERYLGVDASALPRPAHVRLSLLGRRDLAQHFIISAGISASAGKGWADAIGLFKEMKDSQGGSGFSFADLAADQAGVRLAETSTASPAQASRIQRVMSTLKSERGFMPSISELPESIQELEFKYRYKSLDSHNYQLVDREIKRRINACPVFR